MNIKNKFLTNKKAMAALSAVSLIALAFGPAASADFSAVNQNTGFSTTNTVTATGVDTFSQVNLNTEVVTNTATSTTDTGNNTSDNNTGDGSAMSGLLNILGIFSNQLNLNVSTQSSGWWTGQFDAENNTTGSESENDASATYVSTATISNTNDASIDNGVEVDANTGSNSADNNTGDGEAESGNATSTTTQHNTANGNALIVEGNTLNDFFMGFSQNLITGFSSTNNANTVAVNTFDLTNENTAGFTNDSTTTLNTGDNTASGNTGSGSVDGGNASGMATITNDANVNALEVDLSGMDTNSLIAVNEETGSESENNANGTLVNSASVGNTNDASIDNTTSIEAMSGGSESNNNTGDGEVEGGDASGEILIDNGSGLNINETTLSMGQGEFTMTSVNLTTGFSSENNANGVLVNTLDVTNDNAATVSNSADLELTSGENEASNNTGDGSAESGDADGEVTFINDMNINSTMISMFSAGPMVAVNDTTGAESENNATVTGVNSLTISNTNDSEVTNEATIEANSGSNVSSGNTGSGSSSSGSSTVIFGVTNQGNGNSTVIE